MKNFVWSLLYRAGLLALARHTQRHSLTIVLYHGVDATRDLGIFNYRGKFVTPEAFERQLQFYKSHYTVMSLDDAIDKLVTGKPLPSYPLAVTFDDGYQNNFTYAYPLLQKYSIPATVFVTTDFVDKKQPLWVDRVEYAINTGHCVPENDKRAYDNNVRSELKRIDASDRDKRISNLEAQCGAALRDFEDGAAVYAPLTREQIDEMVTSGISFGAHTCSHPILSHIPEQTVEEEIEKSRTVLRDYVQTVSKVFAYPNGQEDDVNVFVAHTVERLGFAAALTTIPGRNGRNTNRFTLHRVTLDATEHFPTFVATVTGVRALLSRLRRRSTHLPY